MKLGKMGISFSTNLITKKYIIQQLKEVIMNYGRDLHIKKLYVYTTLILLRLRVF